MFSKKDKKKPRVQPTGDAPETRKLGHGGLGWGDPSKDSAIMSQAEADAFRRKLDEEN